MAKAADLVHQTTVGTGTGNLTLVTLNGKRSFSAAFGTGSGNKFYYFICNRSSDQWERGLGYMSDATTLVRDTVQASSNSNALVDFDGVTKDVVNDIPAALQEGVVLNANVIALAGLTGADDQAVVFTGPGAFEAKPLADFPVSTLQAAADLAAKSVSAILYITSGRTLLATDAGQTILVDAATAQNMTLPAGVLPAGSFVNIVQWGAGIISTPPGVGAGRVAKLSAYRSNGQYSAFQAWTYDSNNWVLFGDLQV
ncbi:hypothetical protein IZ6_24950 [Terrihabitans soli]|uniref:Uncharacterized protein n=1 Tax=Terrihabitans soli TaxID=708113 RepID=A0A6S6QXK0_9HYPH|nr:hypothetical protein [Terrihabitans soli]BCJ91760.1 hypothetical protein IZ6_24950 [Terrihabitans soli]